MELAERAKVLIEKAKGAGCPQISLASIRRSQDEDLFEELADRAERRCMATGTGPIGGAGFFLGSVDFMAERGTRRFCVLEVNGGSSRGLSLVGLRGWRCLLDGCLEAFDFLPERARPERPPTVLVPHLEGDLLLYERILLAEVMASEIERRWGRKALSRETGRFFEGDRRRGKLGGGVYVESYSEILPFLSLCGTGLCLGGAEIDLIAGDGLARRHPDLRNGLPETAETIIINEMFPLVDDKHRTYLWVGRCEEALAPFGVVSLLSERAADREALTSLAVRWLRQGRSLVLKPHGGSGGCGVEPVFREDEVGRKIEESLERYRSRYGSARSPFPYAAVPLIRGRTIRVEGDDRLYDIRVYVGRRRGKAVPGGALFRMAKMPLRRRTRESYVVNLSSAGGIDVDRGLPLNRRNLERLGLEPDEMVDLFSAACALVSQMARGYRREQVG
jgi:hypothetical protein